MGADGVVERDAELSPESAAAVGEHLKPSCKAK